MCLVLLPVLGLLQHQLLNQQLDNLRRKVYNELSIPHFASAIDLVCVCVCVKWLIAMCM